MYTYTYIYINTSPLRNVHHRHAMLYRRPLTARPEIHTCRRPFACAIESNRSEFSENSRLSRAGARVHVHDTGRQIGKRTLRCPIAIFAPESAYLIRISPEYRVMIVASATLAVDRVRPIWHHFSRPTVD